MRGALSGWPRPAFPFEPEALIEAETGWCGPRYLSTTICAIAWHQLEPSSARNDELCSG